MNIANIAYLLESYSTLLIFLFFIGASLSLTREISKTLPEKTKLIIKIAEWILVVPGFAAIFVLLQQKSTYYFATRPTITITVFIFLAGLFAILIYMKKKSSNQIIKWLGEFIGLTGLLFHLIILGFYFQSQEKFNDLGATFNNLEVAEGQIAPDFEMILVPTNTRQRLSEFKGNLVLLNAWATWCIPCRKEMPDLNKLQIEFKNDGLTVINLTDEPLEKIVNFLEKTSMETIHGRIDKDTVVPDFYQFGKTRPVSFLIDRDGELKKTIIGARNHKYFSKLISKYL